MNGREPLAGATVGNLNPAYDDELGFDPTERGVVVASVRDGTPASRLGLTGGDVVASVNRQSIDNVAQLTAALNPGNSPWTLGIRRKGKLVSVTVR
jgi:serine protease Do